MSKIAVVYWSGTGNTEAMAAAVLEGAKERGADAEIFTPSEFDASMMEALDAMFSACLSKLTGKKAALFGSYGWGDGEWMRSWEETCKEAGVELVCDSVICNEAPDHEAAAACKALGAALAE